MTYNIIPSGNSFELQVNTVSSGTWDKVEDIDNNYQLDVSDGQIVFSLVRPYYDTIIKSSDVIQINGTTQTGSTWARAKKIYEAIVLGGGTDTNFATTDLTFSADRTHAMNGKTLTLLDDPSDFIFSKALSEIYLVEDDDRFQLYATPATGMLIETLQNGVSLVVVQANTRGFYVSVNTGDPLTTPPEILRIAPDGTIILAPQAEYANNAAAAAALPIGALYHTAGVLKIVTA